MLFNSPEFFLFLFIVLLLYYQLRYNHQNWLLLFASYFFYGLWDYRFLSLILVSTAVDFWVGKAIYHCATNHWPGRSCLGRSWLGSNQYYKNQHLEISRRLLLCLSLAVNLGILGFFKYFNFFVDSTARLLTQIGFEPHLPVLYVLLPVGISFYTFQTMGYTIDVYRGKIKPVDNLRDFALYVSYFPQLVAGPIERPNRLIPALQSPRTISTEALTSGGMLILIGLFRKVVIADAIGGQVDAVFAAPWEYSSPELAKGIYLFALQIYCDFAGYTDIARGVSRLLGIELMENFRQPYFSANISEFWRRWHISLSSWLRDYLYIPLGGNRGSTLMTYRNLMLTMLLGGLWHGAAWTFVIWGGLHGLYLAVHRLIMGNVRVSLDDSPKWFNTRRVFGGFLTFHLVLVAWIFFRAPGFGAAIEYIEHLLEFRNMEMLPTVLPAIAIPWAFVWLIDVPQFLTRNQTVVLQWPLMARNVAVASMLFLILLGFGTRAPFIYFQF